MKRLGVPVTVLFAGLILQAQDPCPSGGLTKSGSSGQMISWSSYMVKTPDGVCLERRVHTQGRMYVNWPAAEMYSVLVNREFTTTRRGFLESTLADADLEYGVLGQKLKTTVYQGYKESAGNLSLGVTGSVQAGDHLLPVQFSATTSSSTQQACTSQKEPCRVRYVLRSGQSTLTVKWAVSMAPQFQVPTTPDGKKLEQFVLERGKSVTVDFVTNTPATDSVSVQTNDGQVVARVPAWLAMR